jgi:Family of unknown function (DUF6152)
MKTLAIGALSAILLVSAPLFAHHGNASYDVNHKTVLKGTVTRWIWANPHCWLKFDVKDANGKVVHWVGETNNSADMIERGWSRRTFKPGDAVTITLEPAKNGTPVGRITGVVLANGQKLGMKYLNSGTLH